MKHLCSHRLCWHKDLLTTSGMFRPSVDARLIKWSCGGVDARQVLHHLYRTRMYQSVRTTRTERTGHLWDIVRTWRPEAGPASACVRAVLSCWSCQSRRPPLAVKPPPPPESSAGSLRGRRESNVQRWRKTPSGCDLSWGLLVSCGAEQEGGRSVCRDQTRPDRTGPDHQVTRPPLKLGVNYKISFI